MSVPGAFHPGGPVPETLRARLFPGERVLCRACAFGHPLECENDRCGKDSL